VGGHDEDRFFWGRDEGGGRADQERGRAADDSGKGKRNDGATHDGKTSWPESDEIIPGSREERLNANRPETTPEGGAS
jgi:hypothetical protein